MQMAAEAEAPASAAPAAAVFVVPAAPHAAELQAEIEVAPQSGAHSSPALLRSLSMQWLPCGSMRAPRALQCPRMRQLLWLRSGFFHALQGPADTRNLSSFILMDGELYGHL
jgi:hypothetical protein